MEMSDIIVETVKAVNPRIIYMKGVKLVVKGDRYNFLHEFADLFPLS